MFLLILIVREIYYPFRILRHSSEFLISACFWDEIQFKRLVRIDENMYGPWIEFFYRISNFHLFI